MKQKPLFTANTFPYVFHQVACYSWAALAIRLIYARALTLLALQEESRPLD